MKNYKRLQRKHKERMSRLKIKNIEDYLLVRDLSTEDFFVVINTKDNKQKEISKI